MFPSKIEKILVFDFESTGLYGAPFAYGAVVLDAKTLVEIDSFAQKDFQNASDYTFKDDWDWVDKMVVPALFNIPLVSYADSVIRGFAEFAVKHGMLEGTLAFAAECAFPVESRALTEVMQYIIQTRGEKFRFNGPYPLHEISTVMMIAGMDIYRTYERLPEEQPAHNPLADARLSARLLRDALERIQQP